MANNSIFKSRSGKLSCTPEVFFNFITDIRNLEQFVPQGKISNWIASSDSCSFNVPPLGSANVKIVSKDPYKMVEYAGEVLKTNNFRLTVSVSGHEKDMSEASLLLTADLNPMLKMMATGPIEKFLELLISEMEQFDKWKA